MSFSLFVDRRRAALLEGCVFPEPLPTLTEEDWEERWDANVVVDVGVERVETKGVCDGCVELVLSWMSRIKRDTWSAAVLPHADH